MRRVLMILAVTASLVAGMAGSAMSVTRDRGAGGLALARPTGGHPVGRAVLHLVDADRDDPWFPDRRRELMVSVWYPASRLVGRPAPYTTRKESELLVKAFDPSLPADLMTGVATYARVDAPLWSPRPGLPLVLLSPGWSLPRVSLSGLALDLASRGYAVAAVDHTYESTATEFPDGRLTGCAACERLDALPAAEHEKFFEGVTASRAADLSFVIDELTGPRGPWAGGRWIDQRRMAAIGHSAGGSAALGSLVADRRVRAGVDLDGRLSPPVTAPLRGPVLLLGEQESRPGGHIGWDPSWDRMVGWKRWLTVAGMGHESFSDIALLLEQLGRPMQPLPAARCVRIVNDYLTAFLDLHLRGRPQPLLDGPSAAYPEVRFH
jgi:dienelactone hydrolase